MDRLQPRVDDAQPRQYLLAKRGLGMIERQLKIGDSEHEQERRSGAIAVTSPLRSSAGKPVFYSSHAFITISRPSSSLAHGFVPAGDGVFVSEVPLSELPPPLLPRLDDFMFLSVSSAICWCDSTTPMVLLA